MADPRPCKRCKMKIELIEGPNGKNIPAQKVRVVYALVEEDGVRRLSKIEFTDDPKRETYVNHYETCPHADSFSKGRHRAART